METEELTRLVDEIYKVRANLVDRSIVRDFVSFRESSFPDENSVIDTFRSMPVRYVCKLGSVPFLRAMTLYEAKKHTCAQFEMPTISSSSIPPSLDVSFLLFLLLSKKLAPTMNVQSRDSIIPLFHFCLMIFYERE